MEKGRDSIYWDKFYILSLFLLFCCTKVIHDRKCVERAWRPVTMRYVIEESMGIYEETEE